MSASLVFEQTYGEVDGDSASLAELCALLSSLADAPIAQSFAVTGSVNQLGQVQAIGAVNDKIEGFFDICQRRGLTGAQGVLIPSTNVDDLMLRQDVVDAAAAGRFHVIPVSSVDQAIEVLTGIPAGEPHVGGGTESTINGRVAKRLRDPGHQQGDGARRVLSLRLAHMTQRRTRKHDSAQQVPQNFHTRLSNVRLTPLECFNCLIDAHEHRAFVFQLPDHTFDHHDAMSASADERMTGVSQHAPLDALAHGTKIIHPALAATRFPHAQIRNVANRR